MKTICLQIVTLLSFSMFINCSAQSDDTLVVAFWNLENLFDTIDDPEKNDKEWLPDGEKEWTEERLDKKFYNLARVIRSMNSNNGPDLLGVCEVENQAVLDSMISRYLSDLGYKTAYIESPDNRGIDNGLIYKTQLFKLLNVQADTVHLSDAWPTRLIFGVNLLTKENEKITVFVNHWPSRSGGEKESEPNRIAAAQTLRSAVDRIFEQEQNAQIFLIGDFNDEPTDISLLNYLQAEPLKCDSNATLSLVKDVDTDLFNLSYNLYENGIGSYKYKDDWNMLDQIIVSRELLLGQKMRYICGSFEVYKPEYIVTKTGNYKGAPFPGYGGSRYLGGYSDHFPVIAKFLFRMGD